MYDLFLLGIHEVVHPYPLFLIFAGTVWGIAVGCIPGFTITMGVALILPLTFGMTSIQGLSIMLGVLVGGLAGGQISGILLGIPGTPSSIATVFDGHPMAKKGGPGNALCLGVWSSFFGGLIGFLMLLFFMPPLANIALKFGPWEFFSLIIFGLTIIASLSGKSLTKGIIAGLLGLISATFGCDPITGIPRFTFNLPQLAGGFSFLPVLIGLFAFSQLMGSLEIREQISSGLILTSNFGFSSIKAIKTIFRQPFNLIRSSLIGIFVGALPGAGGSISNIMSYDQALKASKTPEKFGTGVPAGVIASEAANNGTGGGGLIPTMALGIPGDAIQAVLMGALILHGIQPGPLLIVEFPGLVYGVFVAFFIAHFFMLFVQLYGIKLFVRLITVPLYILVPSILVFCAVGSFSIQNRFFDIWVLLIFGVLGYLMLKFKFPLAPMILGVILGPMAETEFRRAFQTSDDYTLFFTRPISLAFLILSVISILYPLYQKYREKKRASNQAEA